MRKLLALIFCLIVTSAFPLPVLAAWTGWGAGYSWQLSTDCTGVIQNGAGCYNTSTHVLYIGNGTAAIPIGGEGSFVIAAGKVFTVNNTLTLSGADGGALVLTTNLTNNGGTGTLTWPAAGATFTVPSGGGTAYVVGGTDVAITDGGTGQSSATLGFNALSPMSALGDMIYGAASPAGQGTRLVGNIVAAKYFLTQTGTGAVSAIPTWALLASGDIPSNAANTSGTAAKATNLVGGNGTTLLGSTPYQSGTDATTQLPPNVTTTKKFYRETGDGTNGTAPAWDTITSGDLTTALITPPAIGGTTPAPGYFTPAIMKGPAIITSFAGTVSTSGSSTTITWSSAADAILAGYNATNPVLGTTLITTAVNQASVTRYIVSWTNATTCVVDSACTLAASSTLASVQLPIATFVNSAGVTTGWMNAAGVPYFAGNVGIGTTTPLATLSVQGTTNNTQLTLGPNDGGASFHAASVNNFNFASGARMINGSWIAKAGEVGAFTVATGAVSFYQATGQTIGNVVSPFNLNMKLSAAGGLSLGSSSTATDPGAGNMIISGNVGIGTTSPIGKQQTVIAATAPAIFGGATVGSYTTCTLPTANKDYVNKTGIGTASTVGDLVVLTGGTGAYTGIYEVLTIVSANSIQLTRTCHNSGSDITDGAVSIATAPRLVVGTNRTYHQASLINATSNEIALKLDYTVNKATSGNDTGLQINKTNTASPGTSRLISLGSGGVSYVPQFEVDGNGVPYSTGMSITAGSGTGITVNSTGNIQRQVYKVTITYVALAAAGLTADVVVATLPAKTRLVSIITDTTTPYTGGTVSAATLQVGKTTGGLEYIVAHDVLSGAVTKGLADADLGTSINRANAVQGGDLPSWTGTTSISARLTTVGGNTNTLAAGSTTYYLTSERY